MKHFNQIVEAQLEADRFAAQYAARPAFAGLTPAQQATELVARIEAAKLTRNRPAFDAAKAELKSLIEQL